MNLNKHRGKNDLLWISKVHLGRSNTWPFCRKCRELVLTSGRITWRQCCFLSILLNNVWSASSAKSRNEKNCREHRPYLNARLRKDDVTTSRRCTLQIYIYLLTFTYLLSRIRPSPHVLTMPNLVVLVQTAEAYTDDRSIRRKKMTHRVLPFKVTRGHRKRHGSIRHLWLPVSDP